MNILPNPEVNFRNWTTAEWLFTMAPGATLKFGLIDGLAYPTGVAILFILTVMILFSFPCVRRGGHFEVQYEGNINIYSFM